jgi:hypothetical protein
MRAFSDSIFSFPGRTFLRGESCRFSRSAPNAASSFRGTTREALNTDLRIACFDFEGAYLRQRGAGG